MSLRTEKNYWQREISCKQKARMGAEAGLVTVVTAWLYYRSWWAVLPLVPLGVCFYRSLGKDYIEKRQGEFLLQFKEMIQSMAASLGTGYSLENALKETKKEMGLLYPEGEMILRELAFMNRQVQVQIPAEQVMEEFAARVQLEDVRNFATVFSAAKRSGGDMIAIIRNTVEQIGGKIDVRREIDTILAARKYEFRVMAVIPYMIITYMVISFPEFMGTLYHNGIGIGVMTICLGVYVAAYALGVKMTKIPV